MKKILILSLYTFLGIACFSQRTDTFFANQGIILSRSADVQINDKALVNEVDKDWAVDSKGLYIRGILVPGGRANTYTGGSNLQTQGGPDLRYVVSCPSDKGSRLGRGEKDMQLTMPDCGLHHALFQQRYEHYIKNTIVGMGKMYVYNPAAEGQVKVKDVQVLRTEQHTIDSFYINGRADNLEVMDRLHIRQHMVSPASYTYDFLGKEDSKFLMRFCYSDSTYSHMTAALEATDINSLLEEDEKNETYSVIVFPNPGSGEINVQLIGKAISQAKYVITDLSGKLIQQGQPELLKGGSMKMTVDNTVGNGEYLLSILDAHDAQVLNERVDIRK